MVAIVAGNGLGLRNTSLNTFNAGGVFEQSAIGQGDDRAIVNVVSGNLILQSQDAQLAGRGTDLFALRTYNSLGTPTDGDQDGWRWGFEQTLRFQGPGAPAQPDPGATVIRTNGDGHEETYTWNAARSAYVGANGGANDELRYDGAAANWIWTNGSTRETELYSNSTAPGMIGRLLRRTDISNNSIALEYDGGRLSLIQDTASQQELRLRYGQFNGLTRLQRLEARSLIDDANGQPTATPGDPLRLVEYDYDNQGRLTTVKRLLTPAAISATNGSGFITNYNYEASTNRIASVTSSDGTSVSFAYDAARRLSAVMDHGGASRAQLAFSYGPQPNTTEIADGDGQIWTYRHDVTTGQLTEIVTPPVGGTSLSTTFSYDANGNLVGMTDPQNNAMTYGYDDVGNRALERDAVGNTMTRTFSPLNQVLTETRYRIADSDGAGPQVPGDPFTTRYVYDANLRLRFVVSAEGRVTENRYASPNASHGLVTETMLSVGQPCDVTGLDPTQQLTEMELIDWVAGLPDKTQVQLTEYSYDLRGNVSRQISYATVNTNGAGVLNGEASVAEYNYDAYGRLRRSVAVRGSARDQRSVVKSFEYDGIMRVLKSNGAEGDQTTNYDDPNRLPILVSASGLKEMRDFDSRGRLASVSQEGDGTTRQTRNVYDNSDQLRMVEDSQGGRRYRFFDAAGRLAFKVDAIGAVTQFEHNAAGLLVRQTQYLNLANTDGWYDENTQLVTKTDLTVGGPGSDVIVDPAHDRVTTFAYDEAGRLTASTDGENIMTMITYDGLSRVIMTQTGARTTRYLYDKDNRRIGIVDALNYLTEYKYDAGGRLIKTVRYSQRSPETVNMRDQLSAWRPAVLDALHSYLYYDGQGRVVGAVDEQQFLTETIFDDALNTRRTLRYLAPVIVAQGDNLASLKSRAGASHQLSFIQYDDFGRILEATTQDGSTVTRNEYDAAGRLTRVVSAANTSEERIRCTFYNAFGEVTATLGGEGSAWLGTNPSAERVDEAIRDYGIRYEYDTLGRKVRSVDANGNRTVFYYDRENRRTQTVNVIGKNTGSLAGEVSEIRYNTFGEAEAVRNYATRIADADMVQLLANGGGGLADQTLLEKLALLADANLDQLSLFEYDRCGRVAKEVDAEGGFKRIFYNEHGELISEVKSIPGGHTTKQFIYDLKGRLISRTDDAGIINANTRTEYDAFGRVIQTVNAVGLTTTTAYPDHGRRVVLTDPLERTTSTEYDALGRVSIVTNGLGQQTTYAYDEAARTVTVTTPEGSQKTTTLTRHGETLSIEDGRGNVTRNEFNLDGQITAVMDALDRAIAQTRYDKSGRKVDVGDGRGAFASFRYDQRNRVIERRFDANRLNLTTQFEFDALGNQISMREWSPIDDERITTYTYDRKGRTKTIILDAVDGGLKLCTTYRYDDLDNVVSIARGTESSPNQQVMLYEFDNLGRRVKEVAAPSSVFDPGASGTRDLTTQDRYDARGRITRRIDANGQSTWHVYDPAGQQTHSISALGEVSESRYDAAGRLVYSHRYLNRLGADVVASFGDVVAAVPPLVAPTNDQISRLVYDGDGRVRFSLKSTGAMGWTISENRCDANGNVIEARAYDRSLPDGRVAALDSSGSQGSTVAEIQQELFGTLGYREEDPPTLAGVQRTFFAYDANNRLRFTVDPSGSVVESVWDPAGGLLATVRFAARPALVAHTEVEIDAAVDREDLNNWVMHYARDRANRLRYTVDALGAISESKYDGRGNLVRTIGWYMQPVLSEYTENAITTAFATLSLTADDEVTNFVYDSADRLRFTIDAAGSITENNYDALGNVVTTTRFARRPTPAPATFTEAAISEAVEPLRNEAENQINRFVYGAEKRLRFKIDTLGSITESVYDANGNLLVTKSFATRPTLTQHDEETVAAAVAPLESDPGNRFNRFAYDAVNRLRFSVDSLGSVSERVHNALGNVIGSIRFALRPTLALHSESAIETAVAPERDHAGNRIEHYLHDALGRVRLSVLRVSVEGNLSKYQVTSHELNALGQIVSSTSFATAVPLGDITEAAIFSALGGADPSRDRVVHFVYDLAGRQIYRVQAVILENNRLKYRVSAQRFDALGQLVGGTDFATAVFLDGFNKDAIDFAVNAVSDQTRDRVSAIVYDAVGQVIYNVGALGPNSHHVTKQDHDSLGRVFRTTQYANAVGALANFDVATVEAAANAVRDANDRKVLYVRDSAGRQRFVIETDSIGRWTVGENQYDALGNIVESRRYDQFVTDARIATIEAIRPTGLSEQDVTGELAFLGYIDSEPDALANIQRSRFAYDTQNRLRFTIDALGGVAENVYNTFGDLTTTVRFASRPALSQYSENAIDAAVDRNNAANRVEHFAYDSLGQLRFSVQVIEPNAGSGGSHSLNERRYDSLGQLIESLAYFKPIGHLNAYDEATLTAAIAADPANDRRSVFAYDAGGRQTFTVRELNVGDKYLLTKQIYDALGQMVQRVEYATPVVLAQVDTATIESAIVTNFNDRTTTTVRDAAGRARFEIRPDTSFRESLFDALDRVIEARQFNFTIFVNVQRTEAEMIALRGNRAVGDGGTRGTAHVWDAAGRLISTVDALRNTERYEYNAAGGRTRWVDKNGNVFTCVYDRKGRKASETSPPVKFKLSGEDLSTPAVDRELITRFEYDAFGNVIRKIEAANFAVAAATSDFLFDTLGRPIGTLYHGFYDAITGRVERITGANRFRPDATITYDVLGNAVRFRTRTGVDSFLHTYRTYNSQGQLVHEVNARNNVTRYTSTPFGEP